MQSRSVSLPITLPASTSLGIVPLSVMLEREDGQEYSVRPTIRVAEGPTIEFFANSHRESLYLQPGAESGCSESCRFGTRWTYKLDVPFACTAKLSALVGAHQAGPWTVQWSQDGSPAGQFTTLLEGRSDQAWHSAEIPALPAGDLFVKLEGDNEQLGELVVTWVEE